MPGQEVKDAQIGNLGLQDRKHIFLHSCTALKERLERQAMRWVQRYISQFGGDPTKVTM